MLLCIFGFLVILALGGLAVDAGNLYFAQLRLQKAVDAASVAGIGYTIERGEQGLADDITAAGGDPANTTHLRKHVQLRTDEILRENMRAMGIPLKPCSNMLKEPFCSHYDPDNRIVRVAAYADIDFLLIDAVPFEMFGVAKTGGRAQVGAAADTERPKANIALILDVSGSMACPVNDPDCTCRLPGSKADCTGELKVDKLIDGLLEFVRFFDTKADRFSVVPFNMRALRMPGGFEGVATSLINRDHIRCLLNGLGMNACGVGTKRQPASNTNVCDAFIEAFADVSEKGIVDKEEIAYLYFSDGAPTAGRFFFNTHPSLPENDPFSFGSGTKDYIHYAVQWVEQDGKKATAKQAPSLLVKTQSLDFHWSQPTPPAPDPLNPGLHVPLCHQVLESSGAPSEWLGPEESTAFCNVFNGCLGPAAGPSSLEYHLPWVGKVYGSDVSCSNADAGSREQNWRKQYFHCAISMADFMREKRGTFFVIGLGPKGTTGTDPYQNLEDQFSRKDYFLSRVANDYRHAVQIPEAAGDDRHPEFVFDGYNSYDSLSGRSSPRFGEYLATPDPSDLRRLFRRMAKRISLRLIR